MKARCTSASVARNGRCSSRRTCPSRSARHKRLIEGSDVSIFACGHLVWRALQAAEELANEGVKAEVINVHTIKPLDVEAVLSP